MSFTRRKLLADSLKLGAATAGLSQLRPRLARSNVDRPPLLLTVAGLGGYALQDSFLGIRESEAGRNAPGINCFPDAWVQDIGPFRALDIPEDHTAGALEPSFQPDFVRAHQSEMLVYTHRASSVNHPVAQQRVLNGDRAYLGRTIMEAVAAHHGESFPLANVNMAVSGFAEHGYDVSLPSWAKAISVPDPWMFPLALSGYEGLSRAWAPADVQLMRALREGLVEAESEFLAANQQEDLVNLWGQHRQRASLLESASAIRKLNLNPTTDERPFDSFGLPQTDDLARLQAAFPRLATDPFEAQAALAFLLLKHRLSVSVAISPAPQVLRIDGRTINPNSAFDASHGVHRPYQAVMWNRVLRVAHQLIELLKTEPDGPGTLWDRTVLFMPSEFGREAERPDNAHIYGTAHDLEGGNVIISPLANGGRVLGDINPSTARLYAFDPEDPSGVVDTSRTGISEEETLAGVLHLLEVPTPGSGLPDVRALRKRA